MFPRCEVTKHSSKRIYDIVVVAVHCSSLPHTIAVLYDLGFFRQRTTFAVMTRVRNNSIAFGLQICVHYEFTLLQVLPITVDISATQT